METNNKLREALTKILHLTNSLDALAAPATTEKSSAVGDAAKLRVALETLRELLGDLLRLGDAEYHNDFSNFCDIIDAALSAPPRNCDVGSAEGQYARFVDMCHANVDLAGRCRESCPFRRVPAEYKCDRAECYAEWAQMPYEEGGAR